MLYIKNMKKINNFLKQNSEEKKPNNFFCTGVIAKKAPDLIHQISSDGHEIACHYYYHDLVSKEKPKTLRTMLWKARESLENASCKKVRGFRAPCFSINKSNPIQYKIIEEVFDYDSSFICSSLNDIKTFQHKMELTNLKLIPLYGNNFLGVSLRLGGSYLKNISFNLCENSHKKCPKGRIFSTYIYSPI